MPRPQPACIVERTWSVATPSLIVCGAISRRMEDDATQTGSCPRHVIDTLAKNESRHA